MACILCFCFIATFDVITAQAAKRIGVTGLFTRSLPLRIMIVGPMATAQWLCYDTLKVLVGL